MRDAFVAALTLNVFHQHRPHPHGKTLHEVVICAIVILTDTKGTGHMVLTPTYHVFNML